jgi:hypothetical protein
MTTFGEISWNDESFDGDNKKKESNKDIWLRLGEGSNEVRLITQPYQYLVHKYKKEGDPGFGQKVYCSSAHGSCPLCDGFDGQKPDKAKQRWLLGVISRKDGTAKILDVSYAVFGSIRKLARGRWGDPTKYDIDIIVDKNAPPNGYYSVQPIEKTPLSATDQKLKEDFDLDELKRKVTPPSAEQVQKRLDKINGVTTDAGKGKTAAAPKAAQKATPPVDMSDDEDMENLFPAHGEGTQA